MTNCHKIRALVTRTLHWRHDQLGEPEQTFQNYGFTDHYKLSVLRCSHREHLQRDQRGSGGRGGQPQSQLRGGGQPCSDLGDVAQCGHGGGGQVTLASHWSILTILSSHWSVTGPGCSSVQCSGVTPGSTGVWPPTLRATPAWSPTTSRSSVSEHFRNVRLVCCDVIIASDGPSINAVEPLGVTSVSVGDNKVRSPRMEERG